MNSEANLLARCALREEHGVGLPSDIDISDLDPDEIGSWSGDQLRRAEASGLLASLGDEEGPESVRSGGGEDDGEDEADGDGSDGMCKLRKLYRRLGPDSEGAYDALAAYRDAEHDEELRSRPCGRA